MRAAGILAVAAALVVVTPAAGVTPSGEAGTDVTRPSQNTAVVTTYVGVPGGVGSPSVSSGPVVSGGSTADRMCWNGGAPITCRTGAGGWSERFGCYLSEIGQEAPGAIEGVGGVTVPAAPGSVLNQCTRPDGVTGLVNVPAGEAAAGGGVAVDPEVLARSVVESMGLRAVGIGIVPEPGPDRVGLVGMPVWLWVSDSGPQTWGPVTASASVGAVTSTSTAVVREVVWDLGDGTTVTCDTPGVVYEDRYGTADSPECGHRYQRTSVDQPGMAYTVSATTRWEVTWSASTGASGVIPVELTADTQIRVGELQVLLQ